MMTTNPRQRVSAHRLSLVACLPALATLAFSTAVSASNPDVIEQQGEWQVRIDRSSGMVGDVCAISTVNQVEGGRRERARISLIPATRTIVIDPDRTLAGAVTGVAVIEDRSWRSQPERVITHSARVDGGEIVTRVDQEARHGALEETKDAATFARIVQSLSNGKLLRYEWQLDTAGRSYEFSLDGFKRMREVAETNPACTVKP
jgi:hypothetical protein